MKWHLRYNWKTATWDHVVRAIVSMGRITYTTRPDWYRK